MIRTLQRKLLDFPRLAEASALRQCKRYPDGAWTASEPGRLMLSPSARLYRGKWLGGKILQDALTAKTEIT